MTEPSRRLRVSTFRLAPLFALLATAAPAAEPVSPEQAEFFEAKVRPVLVEACQKCHGPSKQTSGLRLDSREAILAGGVSGPAVVPGNPDGSLLVQVVRHTHDDFKMPPKKKLPDPQVEALAAWVKMGAPWPAATARTAGKTAPTDADPAATHWAFRPVTAPTPPAVQQPGWVRTPVDTFVLARLEKAGIAPSPEADRRTLIRRLSFDLLGLPPKAAEVEAFVNDPAPDAYERLVDRLLASPHYGERWARHWLDVARYSDTKGYVFQEERRYPFAYTYRDYVIRAFNQDKPYDQFVVEQLAADRLGAGADPSSLAALGFLTVGRRFLNVREDIIDDRIDVMSRGLLGLTVGCARCHDHKFDPIPSEDYYSLFGVFASSTEPAEAPEIPAPVPADLAADFKVKVAEKQKALDAYSNEKKAAIAAEIRANLPAYLRAAVDLNFEGRNPKIEDRAKADKIASGRLRGVMFRWKAHLDATRGQPDPLIAAWHAFAALPADKFAAQAGDLARGFRDRPDPKRPVAPVVARCFAENPPKSMAEVAARYGELFVEASRRKSDDADWKGLRGVFEGNGPFAVTDESLPRWLDRAERTKYSTLNNAVAAVRASHPGSPPRAMVLVDAPKPTEPRVLIRGNPGRPGKAVPRQFLKVASGPNRRPFTEGSGRLEMARAVASPDNPLTARVLVNRVWLQHFGAGLVATPSDFGLRSDPPTHPELLDWLADDFVRHGWSVKHLHRQILLSAAYRQRGDNRPDALAKDPDNRLVWKFNRRRLEFEALRDSVLAAAGTLDPAVGGRPVTITEPPFPPRRTVYGFIDRQNLDGVYRTFDFASPDSSSPRRFVTTVPQQALFLMNSPFLLQQAKALAGRPEAAEGSTADRVAGIYRRLFGRDPEPRERDLGVAFVNGWAAGSSDPAWQPRGPGASASNGLSPWEAYAQVLLLTNEFVFVD